MCEPPPRLPSPASLASNMHFLAFFTYSCVCPIRYCCCAVLQAEVLDHHDAIQAKHCGVPRRMVAARHACVL